MNGSKPSMATALRTIGFGALALAAATAMAHGADEANGMYAQNHVANLAKSKSPIIRSLADQLKDRSGCPGSPLLSEFRYDGTPAYGQAIPLRFDVMNLIDGDVKVEWQVSRGVRVAKVPQNFVGKFKAEQAYSFDSAIVIDQPGYYEVTAKAHHDEKNEFSYWTSRTFYIYADQTGIRIFDQKQLADPAAALKTEAGAPAIAKPGESSSHKLMDASWTVKGNDKETEFSDGIVGNATTTINGTWWYRNQNNTYTNGYGTIVYFYDQNSIVGDTYLGQAVVDGNGNYSFTFSNVEHGAFDGGTADVYVQFRSDNGAIQVKNYGGGTYTSTSGVQWANIGGGTYNAPTWVADWGTFGVSDSTERAFQLCDTISGAWATSNYGLGHDVHYTHLEWQLGKNDVWPNYTGSDDTVHISDYDYYSDDVIDHEYGHSHMDSVYSDSYWPPGAGGSHSVTGHYTEGLAWSEGYATYYSAYCTAWDGTYSWFHPTAGFTFNYETNYDGHGSANSNSDGASLVVGDYGFDTESAVQGMLLDLGDTTNAADFDWLSGKQGVIYDVMRNYDPAGADTRCGSVRHFYQGWKDRGWANIPQLNGDMWNHGMNMGWANSNIGMSYQYAYSGTWYRNGYGSAAVTVKNYGSQNRTVNQLWLWLRGPNGERYDNGDQFGADGTFTLTPGGDHYFFSNTSHILPNHRVLGSHSITYGMYDQNGDWRELLPAEGGSASVLYRTVVADTDMADYCNAQDDGAYQASTTSFHVTAQADDYDGGIYSYWVQLGTAAGSGNIMAWVETVALNQTSFDKTFTGLSITPGTKVYATVVARNTDGYDRWAYTDGIYCSDQTAPINVTVTDDGTQTSDGDSLHFVATGQEVESYITHYWYRIYDDLSNNIRNWTQIATGNITSWDYTATGLTLTPNTRTYYIQVAVQNATGYYGYANTNGIKYVPPTITVSGKVNLPDTVENGKTIYIWVKDAGPGGSYYEFYTRTLDASGKFSFGTTLTGNRGIIIGVAKHLWKQVNANLVSGGVSGLTFNMINGDVDWNSDNAITVFDYLRLSNAFDTVPGDANWDEQADLDEDGVVSVFDYLILSNNFDKFGDS
ncbi:MAG: hypothetical protein JST40_03025 [Armatimonadetes bacterium]|nr:hypothetical protein [Armatimonadota bacterium]